MWHYGDSEPDQIRSSPTGTTAFEESSSVSPEDRKLREFTLQRKRLLRLGYRMLGSITEAEDVLQDAWLRWSHANEDIQTPTAYLTRIVTRLCLDRMKSARARRELYVGPWLPEPLIECADTYDIVSDDVTVTLMLALERLSPLERAAFLLHDVFDMALTEVAVVLEREPTAVRQLASRARRNVRNARPRYNIGKAEADEIVRAFFAASRDGDVAALSELLTRDVEIHTDGGGKVRALRAVIYGLERALRLFVSARKKAVLLPTFLRTVTIDGLKGFVGLDSNGVLQTTALDIRDGRISAIFIVKNPDKLTRVKI
ncbi:RNA polymerase sigma factor SigJ [Agrobacterium sp. BA1120]|uniref:RNA polymerase sigma factor SigJ n=1 Tax=Agrobacterium sp. BA1120 TaxID=3228927 RepID=UPI00336A45D9